MANKGDLAVYIRVSTVSQNLAGQKAAIEAWLKAGGIDPKGVTWFEDKKSGDTLTRPAFEALQKAVKAGSVKTIVVYKLDRVSRSLKEGLTTLHDWLDAGIRFVSVTQQFDFSGPTGKLVAAWLFGVAEMEQEHRRERQAAGIAEAKRSGVYAKNGERRRGYRKADMDRVMELHAKGLKPGEIAASLKVGRSTVYNYIKEAS